MVSPYKPWTRSTLRAHTRPDEFTMDPRIGTLHLLHSQIMSQTHTHTHTHTPHTHTHTYTSTPLLEAEKHFSTLDRTSYVSLGGDMGAPFCLLKAGLLFEPRFLSVWWAELPTGSEALSRILCATKTHSPGTCQESQIPPSYQQVHCHLVGRLTWQAGDAKSQWQVGENTISESRMNLQKCCGIFK
jgi:hypothetical protein